MLAALKVTAPTYTGHPYSWDSHTNGVADYNDRSHLRQQLDHVLLRRGHTQPAQWNTETLAVKSPPWTISSWEGHTHTRISLIITRYWAACKTVGKHVLFLFSKAI
jgi:hypothetical protein